MHEYDNRYLWMNLKRIIGSHFANYREAWEANDLIARGLIHPTLSRTYALDDVGQAALDVHRNLHQGKVGVLTLAPEAGLGVTDPEKRRQALLPRSTGSATPDLHRCPHCAAAWNRVVACQCSTGGGSSGARSATRCAPATTPTSEPDSSRRSGGPAGRPAAAGGRGPATRAAPAGQSGDDPDAQAEAAQRVLDEAATPDAGSGPGADDDGSTALRTRRTPAEPAVPLLHGVLSGPSVC